MYSKMNADKTSPLIRTNSICPTPEEELLDCVLKNNVDRVESIVNDKLLNYIYEDYDKPILLIACKEQTVKLQTIQILIEFGANLRFSDKNQWEALHFAAERADYGILKFIVERLKDRNFNINHILTHGNNALHILIRYGRNESPEYIKCARFLLQADINVNATNDNSLTPIYFAAKNNLKDMVTVLLDCSKVPVDIDTPTARGKTVRDLILANKLYDGTLPDKANNNNQNGLHVNTQTDTDILFNYIKLDRGEDFINFIAGRNLANEDNGSDTLLQKACSNGSTDIVKHLLDNGADPHKTTPKNKSTPLEIAAEHGFYEIFKAVLDCNKDEIPRSVLTTLLKYYGNESIEKKNRRLCCNYLLKKLENNKHLLDINDGDQSKNSPLHYAVRYADSEIINELLQNGASLGSKNKYGFMPIQDMEPEVLEQHLNNCVEFDITEKKEKEEFTITFNYGTLIPPTKRIAKLDSEIGRNNQELVHETEVISYMSRAPEFKHLLMHPVIVTFLFMKWHRIQWLFYTNFAFYVAFFVSLVIYVFSYYANFVDELSSFEKFLKVISWAILLLTFLMLLLRELFQMFILPGKYFKNFENYVEIILIVLAGSILFSGTTCVNTRKQLSSLAILLSAFELVLIVGQHPKLSTNVVMLRTVSYNFFKFLLWYSVLIIAFALSFNILFSQQPKEGGENQTESENEDSFADPGKSVFKTIVMLTGEFEASDINFETFPIVSKLIFGLFIFMIAIILLNLLNGLAVSDTQMIKNDAELLGHISRAQHIRYVENLLLGNVVPSNFFNKISRICCCFPFIRNMNYSIFKPLAQRVCLFPHLFNNYSITVYPNKHGEIDIPLHKKQKKCYGRCCNLHLGKETILRINQLVLSKKEEMKSSMEYEKLGNEIITIKKMLEELTRGFNQIPK